VPQAYLPRNLIGVQTCLTLPRLAPILHRRHGQYGIRGRSCVDRTNSFSQRILVTFDLFKERNSSQTLQYMSRALSLSIILIRVVLLREDEVRAVSTVSTSVRSTSFNNIFEGSSSCGIPKSSGKSNPFGIRIGGALPLWVHECAPIVYRPLHRNPCWQMWPQNNHHHH